MRDSTHMPADHPTIPDAKVGVLIANLGTPDNYDYWSMRRYLSEFLSDQRVIDYPKWKWQPILQGIILSIRPFRSGANYRKIWNHEQDESPLMTITRAQADKLRRALQARFGDRVMVDFAMRYGNPSTKSKVAEMVKSGCDRVLFFPLYPQYSGPTTATANDEFFRALMAEIWQPAARTVPAYYESASFIEALAQSVERVYPSEAKAPDVLVCSYHGVPERYLTQGDPYHCHCQKTTRLLRERLGWAKDRVITTFQSKFGPEEWLKPYTVQEVARLAEAGKTNIAVIAPAFSADCIETLEEINEEIQESFLHASGKTFTYLPCLNDDAAHIAMMAQIVEDNLKGWIEPE
jgi:ferrochelatase